MHPEQYVCMVRVRSYGRPLNAERQVQWRRASSADLAAIRRLRRCELQRSGGTHRRAPAASHSRALLYSTVAARALIYAMCTAVPWRDDGARVSRPLDHVGLEILHRRYERGRLLGIPKTTRDYYMRDDWSALHATSMGALAAADQVSRMPRVAGLQPPALDFYRGGGGADNPRRRRFIDGHVCHVRAAMLYVPPYLRTADASLAAAHAAI